MSQNDPLAAARELWPLAAPEDDEVHQAVRRIQRRMRVRQRRTAPRRLVALVACALALGCAAAYAARGGVQLLGQSEAPLHLDAPLKQGAASLASRVALVSAAQPAAPQAGTQSEAGAALHAEAPARRAARAPGAVRPATESAGSAAPGPTWHDVGDALTHGDVAGAERGLRALADAGDAATKAKAELGLAQLEQTRGDCAGAGQRARSLLSNPAATPAIRRGAQRVLNACSPAK